MLKIHPDIKKAIKKKQAVVALESTIIAHGMPYPQNVETALICERTIRANGALPATIAVLDGVITVGLTISEMEHLGHDNTDIVKTSRRDLAYVVDQKKTGALTVSGTMIAAQMAGIKVFATGGIGGVHRHAETTMDISADLEELRQTNMLVVSAGAKSILDLGKTLEYLETKGIPVIGYQTEYFPAFFTRESDFKVNYRLDSPEAIARYFWTKENLGLEGGILIANPIPDAYSYPRVQIDEAIASAIAEADAKSICGKELTPFLLKRINEITGGKSLEANRRLVYNNCELAAKIAVEYAKLEDKR